MTFKEIINKFINKREVEEIFCEYPSYLRTRFYEISPGITLYVSNRFETEEIQFFKENSFGQHRIYKK